MSLDISLVVHADLDISLSAHIEDNNEWVEVYDDNYTHNVSKMWKLAGCYAALYESDGKFARDFLEVMRTARERFENDWSSFEALNPANGFGDANTAYDFLSRAILHFARYPEAIIRVSR